MDRYIKTMKYGCLAIALVVGFGGFTARVHAATDFMTSWQSRTYVPEWYAGKAFPTYQSAITAGFELIEDGKIVDLSKTAVRWYVDDKLLKNETNGLGIKQVLIFNKKYGGDVSSVRIVIPEYKGRALETTFDVPVKTPEIVIDIPYAQKKIARGTSSFYGWPFFFGTQSAGDLSLRWTVDGKTVEAGSAKTPLLLFTVGSESRPGAKSTIEAFMGNQKRSMENITKRILVDIL